MADATGWERLGTALGGDSELEYQKGLALGAQTQNAMAEARARVEKASAQRDLANQLRNAGLPYNVAEASATTLAAGGNLGDVIGALGKQQEQGFRATAGAPDTTDQARQAALAGVASGPIDVYKNVGPRAYQNLLHPEQGVMPLGDALSGSSGGEAAGIQALRAFHLLGPDGQVVPGKEEQAFNVFRTTQQIINAGGVPGAVNANPFTARTPPAAPGAPSTPTVLPLSTPAQVAANEGMAAGAKKEGEMRAEAKVTLPEAVGELDNMKKNIAGLLNSPGFDTIYGARVGATETGQGLVNFVSQDAANAAARRQQLAANAFTISIQKNRGLGQLSNAEGSKFTDAFTRATQAKLGSDEARQAWQEVLAYTDLIQQRLQQKATGVAPGAAAAPAGGPQPGAVEDGYRFKGGNPADPNSWEQVR